MAFFSLLFTFFSLNLVSEVFFSSRNLSYLKLKRIHLHSLQTNKWYEKNKNSNLFPLHSIPRRFFFLLKIQRSFFNTGKYGIRCLFFFAITMHSSVLSPKSWGEIDILSVLQKKRHHDIKCNLWNFQISSGLGYSAMVGGLFVGSILFCDSYNVIFWTAV